MNEAQHFNALNGEELIKFLLVGVEKSLRESGEFGPAITFPWFEYRWILNVTVYPKQARGAEPLIKLDAEGKAQGNQPDESPTKIELSSGDVVDTPDLARIDSDQPIHIPEPSSGGVTVDKPRKVPTKNLPWLKAEEK